jgi:pyruvate dehydrogenase E2 component (dihydrolipoamide acetyltransferase)
MMITPVEIPKLTLTMESATLVKWLKLEGESVEKDEPLFELETDKTVVEMPSPTRGLLRRIIVREGEVSVGTTIAIIGDAADQLPDITPGITKGEASKSTNAPVSMPATPPPRSDVPGGARATPAARRRARELKLDIETIVGTGPEGRITQEDVEKLASPPAGGSPSPGDDRRRLIAERTSYAWRTIPHIHIGGDLVATGIKLALERGRKVVGATLSVTDLLLYVTASLLGEFKPLNAIWDDNQLLPQSHIHLAFAVQTDFGVMAPVIHNANELSLAGLSAKRKELMDHALARRLNLAQLAGGTFTVTNLGMYPVDFFAPVINHPQTAILATGRVRQIAKVQGNQVIPDWSMWVNLAVDHRAADGATAAQFLQKLEESFETLPSRI